MCSTLRAAARRARRRWTALRCACGATRGVVDPTLTHPMPHLRQGRYGAAALNPPTPPPQPLPPTILPPHPPTLIFTLSPGMTRGSSVASISATTPTPPYRTTPASCACPRSAMPPPRPPTTARRWRRRSSRAFWRRVTQLVGKGAAAAWWRHSAAARQPGSPAAWQPRLGLTRPLLACSARLRGEPTPLRSPRGAVLTHSSAHANTLSIRTVNTQAHFHTCDTQALSPTPSTSPTRRSLRSRASTRASASSIRTDLG